MRMPLGSCAAAVEVARVASPSPSSSNTIGRSSSGASSAISSAFVTQTAGNSRSIRWHPAEALLVTGPGTAPSGRPSAAAWPAVLSDPDRQPASTTTTARLAAAISRLRCRNRHLVGAVPHGTSETAAPVSMIRVSRASWPEG